jgi:hypothetical protein
MFASIGISFKLRRIVFSAFTIGLFIAVSLIPPSQSATNLKYYDMCEPITNQKDIYFVGCVLYIIGRISNPRIVNQGQNKWLVFHAKIARVIGFKFGYDEPESITQWIFSKNVTLSLKTDGPMFRGIVTDNFIIGSQRYSFF